MAFSQRRRRLRVLLGLGLLPRAARYCLPQRPRLCAPLVLGRPAVGCDAPGKLPALGLQRCQLAGWAFVDACLEVGEALLDGGELVLDRGPVQGLDGGELERDLVDAGESVLGSKNVKLPDDPYRNRHLVHGLSCKPGVPALSKSGAGPRRRDG